MYNKIIQHFTDISNFNRFAKKYFDSYLIETQTKDEIDMHIAVGKLLNKYIKKVMK